MMNFVNLQSVKLEAIGGVSVCDLALEVRGQIDDGDGAEWALLWANTATDTKRLGDEGKSGVRSNFNAYYQRN